MPEARVYWDLHFALTHQYFPYEEAEAVWAEILAHKSLLNQKLGRDVGVAVAEG